MRSLRSNIYSRMPRSKKILWITLITFIVLIVSLSFFYKNVQKDYFAGRDGASKLAMEQAHLTTITRVESSIGDDAYHIVFGTDDTERPMVVWVSDTEIIHSEQAEGSFTEAEVRAKVLDLERTAQFLRILPNRIQGVYVWEAFYKKNDAEGKPVYFYTYYRFTDGEYIDTYKLSL